ncbi:MAG: metallophosphoesterase [Abitibacteriaceae bacterium]|nr:metallophosphoesterase [Abditibacteriaceae bacterium]
MKPNSSKWIGAVALLLPLLAGAIAARADGTTVAPNTPTINSTTIHIALLSDTHTTRSTKEDKPLFKGRLDKVIASVNAAHPDLVLIAGDLTDGGLAEQFSDFKTQIQGFQVPSLVVPGNHDVGDKIIPGKEGGITAKRLAQYEAVFGPSFYVSKQPHLRVIAVNSSLLGSGLPQEAQQWDFLEKELGQPATLPTVLLMHYPPFLKTADEAGGGYWNIEPAPRQRLLDLIKRGKVTAVLTGHLHRPLQNQLGETVCITTPPVSWGIPKGKQKEGWTLVTITPQGQVTAEHEYTDD